MLLLSAVSGAQEAPSPDGGPRLGLSLPAGTTVTLFASAADHQLNSPTSLCVDEQGRIFVSETRSVTFAQEAESNIVVNQGETPPLEPALVRLGGEVPLEQASSQLEVIEDPGLTVLGLGSVTNKHMRVLLGRGMDNALSMANKQQGGVRQMDTHEFVAVIDKQGNPVAEWEAHLEEAIRAGNFDPLGEDSMVVRRWRVSAAQRATYFKISFVHLLLCAHMKLEPVAGGFAWTWEGIWGCRLRGAPPEGMSQPLDTVPPVVLNYKEYDRSSKESARKFWRNFFTPIALGVDFGGDMLAHLVDPERDESMFTGK